MNKKVHFIHFSSRPGGIEVLFPNMVYNLENVEISAFVIRPADVNEKNVYDNTKVNVTYGTSGYTTYFHLFRYAFKYHRDIFHVFNIGPFALLMLRLAGVKKLVYAIHGTIYWKTGFQKVIRKMCWNFAMSKKYFVTSNSEFSGIVFNKKVLKWIKPITLYNPIDVFRFNPEVEPRTGFKKIVYSGRLANGKNLIRWIKIAESIHEKYPDIIFEIYGEGPLKSTLQTDITAQNLDNIVFLKGYTNRPEQIYQHADLLIFLSEYESFGNVVVESILCETPVIVSAIPSMKEIFKNFPCFLVELNDDLERNIMRMLINIVYLKEQSIRAAKEFRERFSVEKHINTLNQIYDRFEK